MAVGRLHQGGAWGEDQLSDSPLPIALQESLFQYPVRMVGRPHYVVVPKRSDFDRLAVTGYER